MFNILPLSQDLRESVQHKINNKTKPLGSLGLLEALALQVALIQNSATPQINHPEFVIFAGDHGIAQEGVSPFPQEVTTQMVLNFLNGGGAINSFCTQHKLVLSIVDAGIVGELPASNGVIQRKIAAGTQNFSKQAAMSIAQLEQAFSYADQLISEKAQSGCNLIGFGEMGIANTTSAAAIMAAVLNLPVSECVGRGTGLDDAGVLHKQKVIEQALDFHQVDSGDAKLVLATFGGFEIAMMVGAMLSAASQQMVILVDGFIASAAALIAIKLNPLVRDYMVFCHQSDEQAHGRMLAAMEAQPLLNLGLRLGEGSGAALAYPLIVSAIGFLNEMASFASAAVSNTDSAN